MRSRRAALLLLLACLAALGYALNQRRASPAPDTRPIDVRLPVANPPVEPDRPDLLGEPQIEQTPEDEP